MDVPHLLQALKVVTELGLQVVGEQLGVLTGLDILLSIQEPHWDLELKRILDDGDDTLNLVVGKLTGPIGLFDKHDETE